MSDHDEDDEDDVSGFEQQQEQQTESEIFDLVSLAGSSASGAVKIRLSATWALDQGRHIQQDGQVGRRVAGMYPSGS